MHSFNTTEKIDVLLLCGGLGKRLRSVLSGVPKAVAEINGRPFLDILIDHTASFGFRRFILCIGYKGDEIKRHYQKKGKTTLEILFSEEEKPLDTAGAIKNAESFIKSSPFLVMNADSLCQLDLREFLNFHLAKNALLSMVLAKVKNNGDYGAVSLGRSYRVVAFNEKIKPDRDCYINAGIYLFEKEILPLIPPNKNFSLEKDFFPKILDKRFFGYATQKAFIDIGTPQRYEEAKRLLMV